MRMRGGRIRRLRAAAGGGTAVLSRRVGTVTTARGGFFRVAILFAGEHAYHRISRTAPRMEYAVHAHRENWRFHVRRGSIPELCPVSRQAARFSPVAPTPPKDDTRPPPCASGVCGRDS